MSKFSTVKATNNLIDRGHQAIDGDYARFCAVDEVLELVRLLLDATGLRATWELVDQLREPMERVDR